MINYSVRHIYENSRWNNYWEYYNPRAVSCLNGVAKMLGIKMGIIMDDENVEQPSDAPTTPSKPKGKRRLFSINGSEPLAKNRAVYEAVCLFIYSTPEFQTGGARF